MVVDRAVTTIEGQDNGRADFTQTLEATPIQFHPLRHHRHTATAIHSSISHLPNSGGERKTFFQLIRPPPAHCQI
jgi:hypothetical protein